jgi:hypothetical protein
MIVSTLGPRITVGQETEVAEPITKHTSSYLTNQKAGRFES